MLKKLSGLLLIAAVAFTACNQTKKEKVEAKADEKPCCICVETLMKDAANIVDTEVKVKGRINHVCQHGGKRIHLVSGEEKIVGTASEELGTFAEDLVGKTVVVTAILKVEKITAEDIAKMEEMKKEDAEHKHEEGEHQEHGDAEHKHKEGEHHEHGDAEHKHEEGDHHHNGEGKIAQLKEQLEKSEDGTVSVYSLLVKKVDILKEEVKEETKVKEEPKKEEKAEH